MSAGLAGSLTMVALLALACGKTGNDGAAQPAQPMAEAGAGGVPVTGPEGCLEPQPGPSPLMRLDNAQLANTIRDLFQAVPAVVSGLESALAGFPPNYQGEAGTTPQLVSAYHRLAHEAARAVTGDAATLAAFIGCDPARGDAVACRDQFLNRWLRSMARRPASTDEIIEMEAIFAQGQQLGGGAFASGVRAVVEVALQSPDFLYLVQRGAGGAQGAVVALSSHETAARLSYLLTGSTPDAELAAAADAGPFSETSLDAQARRLLGSSANRRTMRQFMARLLLYEAGNPVDTTLYPTYAPPIAELAREESGRFVEDVVFDGAGTFRALLSEQSTWLNQPLSAFYGFGGVTREEFQKVDLSGLPRAGILTQSAFLNATSFGTRPNPVYRAVVILRNLLCVELPPPPPDLLFPPDSTPTEGTFRERLEPLTNRPECSDCHRLINPVGYAFENYDVVGLWRQLDEGRPIDASGTLEKTDASGSFTGAVELAQRIAESDDARACFVGNWLTYAYGRPEASEDGCARHDVEAAFRDSDGNIVEMLAALAKTDQLRYRLARELAP